MGSTRNNRKKRRRDGDAAAAGAAGAVAAARVALSGRVEADATVAPDVLDQGRVFFEALRQTRPIAAPGTREAGQAARAVRADTARPRGLRPETARRLVTEGRALDQLLSGANPVGKAAEVVVASDYRGLHAGRDPGMVNPPSRIAPNVDDVRLSPDPVSRRDLMFRFRTRNGMLLSAPSGQVKTGSARYVSEDLVKMAGTAGYGKVGYVDARFVHPDGSPRVAPDAFTRTQARRLREAGIRLRGIRDLAARAQELLDNVVRHGADGLDPAARCRLQQLREDVAGAYRAKETGIRMAQGAATAAATAAIVSLVVQAASDGEVDAALVGEAAAVAALFGAGTAAAETAIYHGATRLFDVAPETAKDLAGNGVSAGLCLISAAVDVFAEAKAAQTGEISPADAVAGSAAKSALNLLPLVLAPLGLAGVPILIGAQLGGRWAVARLRETERGFALASEELSRRAAGLHARLDCLDDGIGKARAECDETDRIFASIMSARGMSTRGTSARSMSARAPLRLVKGSNRENKRRSRQVDKLVTCGGRR